eukprot:GHVR01147103.1.p1 GENE.GHVR01147103.1~~GHVR01147103.1.p1  ORF type:complete len:510 (+),score=114.50 GHVR01147103.1:346-1875(+)
MDADLSQMGWLIEERTSSDNNSKRESAYSHRGSYYARQSVALSNIGTRLAVTQLDAMPSFLPWWLARRRTSDRQRILDTAPVEPHRDSDELSSCYMRINAPADANSLLGLGSSSGSELRLDHSGSDDWAVSPLVQESKDAMNDKELMSTLDVVGDTDEVGGRWKDSPAHHQSPPRTPNKKGLRKGVTGLPVPRQSVVHVARASVKTMEQVKAALAKGGAIDTSALVDESSRLPSRVEFSLWGFFRTFVEVLIRDHPIISLFTRYRRDPKIPVHAGALILSLHLLLVILFMLVLTVRACCGDTASIGVTLLHIIISCGAAYPVPMLIEEVFYIWPKFKIRETVWTAQAKKVQQIFKRYNLPVPVTSTITQTFPDNPLENHFDVRRLTLEQMPSGNNNNKKIKKNNNNAGERASIVSVDLERNASATHAPRFRPSIVPKKKPELQRSVSAVSQFHLDAIDYCLDFINYMRRWETIGVGVLLFSNIAVGTGLCVLASLNHQENVGVLCCASI